MILGIILIMIVIRAIIQIIMEVQVIPICPMKRIVVSIIARVVMMAHVVRLPQHHQIMLDHVIVKLLPLKVLELRTHEDLKVQPCQRHPIQNLRVEVTALDQLCV